MLSNTKFYDKRVVAGKTGYTQIAGNTLISLAEDQGRKVVTVVLKDKNPSHYTDTKALLDLAFSETENQTLGEHPGALEALRKELVSAGKITEENKIHFLDTVKTVSYTHLDVYKRQVHRSAGYQPDGGTEGRGLYP